MLVLAICIHLSVPYMLTLAMVRSLLCLCKRANLIYKFIGVDSFNNMIATLALSNRRPWTLPGRCFRTRFARSVRISACVHTLPFVGKCAPSCWYGKCTVTLPSSSVGTNGLQLWLLRVQPKKQAAPPSLTPPTTLAGLDWPHCVFTKCVATLMLFVSALVPLFPVQELDLE